MTIRLVLPKAIGLLGLLFVLPASAEQRDARETLRQVLNKQRSIDYLRFESRPDPRKGPDWLLKVQTVANKGIKVTIISPLTQAGVVSVDDAKVLKTFLPDQDTVVIQPSPFLLQPTVNWRLKLIDQNYVVKFGESDMIAGQTVRALVLNPVNDSVPSRKMYVDTKHDVVLKYVVDPTDGPETVMFDTKAISFGKYEAEEDFGLPEETENAKTRYREGPLTITKPANSKSEAGFSARLIERLPYGFKSSGAYLFKESRRAYVTIKLSDGMATLTLYQWLNSKFNSPPQASIVPKFIRTDAWGVSYGIAVSQGDRMPDTALKRIVETYVSQSE